jgi:hypothetical protein
MEKIDSKILSLIEDLKILNKINSDTDFCERVGLLKQNLSRIKKGIAHFTPVHIANISKVFNVNANWILGVEKNKYRSI